MPHLLVVRPLRWRRRLYKHTGMIAASAQYTISVRSLCEFGAKQGDLDVRFTPSTTAFEGLSGHRTVGERRPAGYLREVFVSGEHQGLRVRGRADGFDPRLNRLEEFKTHRGELERMPQNRRRLHWAQLKTYGALACRHKNLEQIELALVYFDVVSQRETVLHEGFSADALQTEFQYLCERFVAWADQELAHRRARDAALDTLEFPHTAMHVAQRQLAERVYRTVQRRGFLMAQAPTGIGKTLGTLFPALKALGKQRIDKLFFLVAKTSGRHVALDALRSLTAGADLAPLRVLEYAAKESACVYPGRSCTADSCPLAKGFYDRLPQARDIAVTRNLLNQAALKQIAQDTQVCPYYLTQEMTRWSDVIVADYNYYFDASAALYALTTEHQWRVALLVDEAHNLLPRARAMYSATLNAELLAAAMGAAPRTLALQLARLDRTWLALEHASKSSYTVLPAPPEILAQEVERTAVLIRDQLAEDPDALVDSISQFYFDLLYFKQLIDSFGAHSILDLARSDLHPSNRASLCIRNVCPAAFLAPRFAASAATVLFSATLAPEAFYRQLLGVPETAAWLDVASPFRAEQLSVRIMRDLSTRYADRADSNAAIVGAIAMQYRSRPGNYLAFFSSFEYLDQVARALKIAHAEIAVWQQTRQMDAAQRDGFLQRFTHDGQGIGFAVLGGVFAEGVDLPGSRLIGAFIATLGMPQINAINGEYQQRMQQLFGQGFEYTYLYPGLQKVVQAAGRIIRTTQDAGTLLLMDDRFMLPQVRELLPSWWEPQCS
jgi:DNA excision repair protein ERCC-2